MIWLLGCGDPPGWGDPQQGERAAFQAREVATWTARATAAADAGEWGEAARIVALERGFYPDAFAPIEARVRAEAPPEAILRLADPRDPPRDELDRVLIGLAYGPRLEETRAAAVGATPAQARAVVRAVSETWVDPVDPERLAEAVRAHLERLRDDPGFRAAFGELPAAGSLADALDAGWPAEIAAVETTAAALSSLDPWTRAVWPAERAGWEAHHAGVSVGVGLALLDTPDGVKVELPQVGGPAWKGGVRAGDVIVTVDGAPVADLGDAVGRLAGELGTAVKVGVKRKERVFELVRAEVPEETVRGWRRDREGWDPWVAPGVGWVRITAFRPTTDEAFDALTEFAGPAALVLDLRGNEGGDVGAALHVADRFVADGVLVELRGRAIPPAEPGPDGELPWNVAAPGHALEGTPVVVLVDERTASAAEILAAILQARAGAVVVGAPTWGKATSQALRDDPETGAAWQVTTGRWEVAGRPAVVVPDVAVPLSAGETLAVQLLTGQREHPPTHPDGSEVPFLSDPGLKDGERLSFDPQAEAAMLEVARLLR